MPVEPDHRLHLPAAGEETGGDEPRGGGEDQPSDQPVDHRLQEGSERQGSEPEDPQHGDGVDDGTDGRYEENGIGGGVRIEEELGMGPPVEESGPEGPSKRTHGRGAY